MRLNRDAFVRLIEEDIEALDAALPPQSLERQHIEEVLRWSIEQEYPDAQLHPSHGADLIASERIRQMEVERWYSQHDDQHDSGELIRAALCYAAHDIGVGHPEWPWGPKWWKPKDRISNLVRAGALIAAEIDRLQRLSAHERQSPNAIAREGDAEACILCHHPKHSTRCTEDAPNAQFSCACPGECPHRKHPHYCQECVARPEIPGRGVEKP